MLSCHYFIRMFTLKRTLKNEIFLISQMSKTQLSLCYAIATTNERARGETCLLEPFCVRKMNTKSKRL